MNHLLTIVVIVFFINFSNCSFQSTIFNKMNKEKVGENLIISPLSIFQSLSLTANGAKNDTLLEMLDILQCNSINQLNKINSQILSIVKNFTTIDIANAIMVRFNTLKRFKTIAQKYLAPVEPLISVEQVNGWCKNKTHGKIDKILKELESSTLMILLNAVYFRGEWMSKFEPNLTKKMPFYNLGNKEIKVFTMTIFKNFRYFEDKKCQTVQLDFMEDYMSAIIILPSKGTDINKFIDSLSISSEEYNKITIGLDYKKVLLQLPKFELEFEENLNQILQDLGMYNAFSPKDADFTGIKKEGGIFINSINHKTYLKVFEDGCEAAAVTETGLVPTSDDEEEKIYEMKVNRPFLFLIKNSKLPKGHDLVFMSKIENL